MKCFSCGEELFDNGDERFPCPYCGAEVSRSQTASPTMPQDDDSSNRANRREFWLKTLLLLVFVLAVIAFGKSFEAKLPICLGIALIGACGVVTLFYAFGVVRRRLHDFGCSGWWFLLYVLLQNVFKNVSRSFYDDVWSWVELVALILVGVLPGTPGRNEYGAQPPPKQFPFWPWKKAGGDGPLR